MVRLKAEPSSSRASEGRAAETAQFGRVKAQQQAFIASVRKIDKNAKVLGQTQRATNIVALQVDSSKLDALAKAPNVVSIHPVVNYQKALSETVPYIGAQTVQNKGFKGAGVRVGIIDSGIDYTHVEFGGAGTAEAYEAAYGTSPGRLPQPDARRPLPDLPRQGRVRLRRRELAGRRRHRGSRSRSHRPRGSRHPCRGHRRRHARRRPEGLALRAQGLLGRRHGLLRRRAHARHGLGRRSQRRRQHQRPPRHREHVARRATTASPSTTTCRSRSTPPPSWAC